MSAPNLLVELDGETVPIRECTWIQTAPCGCDCGATVVEKYGKGLRVIGWKASPDEAFASFYDTKAELERDRKLGYTIRLAKRDAVLALKSTCPHDPKWGHPTPPQVEGYEWLAPQTFSSNRRLHLVKLTERNDGWGFGYGEALCGAERRGGRVRMAFETRKPLGLIECVTCTKKADGRS